jgi:PilZ domain
MKQPAVTLSRTSAGKDPTSAFLLAECEEDAPPGSRSVTRVPSYTEQTTNLAERPSEHRRVARIPFKATCAVTETDSSRMVVAQISELGRFGCFVQTRKPYRKGTRTHIEITEGGTTFVASGVVTYVTGGGMGVVFSMVEPESSEVLATWLSRKPRQSDRYGFAGTAEVKELGSWKEQVLIIRDLSAGGCFVKTAAPVPKGSRIRVRIEHARTEFTAIGRVTDNITAEGMGVEFIEMEPRDRAILEKWLAEKTPVMQGVGHGLKTVPQRIVTSK